MTSNSYHTTERTPFQNGTNAKDLAITLQSRLMHRICNEQVSISATVLKILGETLWGIKLILSHNSVVNVLFISFLHVLSNRNHLALRISNQIR